MLRFNDTLVVNMTGGPGTGKSTTAAGLFYQLKAHYIESELVLERAKELVWEGRGFQLADFQLQLFAEQHRRIARLLNKVAVVVTDSPLFLSLYFGQGMSPAFRQMVLEEHSKLTHVNVMLNRVKPYVPNGRREDEASARSIDTWCREFLETEPMLTIECDADEQAPLMLGPRIHMLMDQAGIRRVA